jgi:hypothetical protein
MEGELSLHPFPISLQIHRLNSQRGGIFEFLKLLIINQIKKSVSQFHVQFP